MVSARPARRRARPAAAKLPNRLRGMGSFALGGIEVRNELPSRPLSEAGIRRLMGHYLRQLGCPKASLSLLLCGDAASRGLNRRFRRKDKPTDVLSFPAQGGRPRRGFSGQLGDLALNIPYARRKLGRFAETLEGEAAFLLLHGLLHLCGRHHDTPAEEAALWRLKGRLFPPPRRLIQGLKIRRRPKP